MVATLSGTVGHLRTDEAAGRVRFTVGIDPLMVWVPVTASNMVVMLERAAQDGREISVVWDPVSLQVQEILGAGDSD